MVTCKGPKANLNTGPNMQRVDSFQIGGVPGKHSQAEGNNYTEEKRDELKTMAGSLVVYEGDSLGNSVTSIKYQSEVQFSRFFNHVSVSTACPILIPYKKKARSRGTWMSSTPSSNVFLQIRTDYSCSEPILAIYLGEKLLVSEEF